MHQKKIIKCISCIRKFVTPSAHCAHWNMHAPLNFVCETCGTAFPVKSALRVHRKVHTAQCQYKCFAGACTKRYKWSQDLHQHMAWHLNHKYSCAKCSYSNSEEHLLKRHLLVHDKSPEAYKYHCPRCVYKSKYYSLYHKHLHTCKGEKS